MSSLIERSSDWFERYLVPPLSTLASNIYLQAVRDAFIAVRRPGEWLSVLERWYGEDLPGRYPLFDEELGENCAEAA